jgi:formate hydrogenlyase subunit 4
MTTAVRAAIKLFIRIFIFVGLFLIGWDVKDVWGIMIKPARIRNVVVIVLLQIFIVIRLPEVENNCGNMRRSQ